MRVTDKLLAIGLLTDKDLDQLLCLIDPASFDNGLYSGIMSVICTAVFVRRGTKKGKGKGKGSPYSITERRVPERIPVLGSQPAQPLRGLLSVLLLGEQRHSGCEQIA